MSFEQQLGGGLPEKRSGILEEFNLEETKMIAEGGPDTKTMGKAMEAISKVARAISENEGMSEKMTGLPKENPEDIIGNQENIEK